MTKPKRAARSAPSRKRKSLQVVAEVKSPPICFRDLVSVVAAAYDISTTDLCSRSRFFEFTRPRQVLIYLAKHMLRMNWSSIGRRVHRDHSTCIHAGRLVHQRMASDIAVRAAVRRCARLVCREGFRTRLAEARRKAAASVRPQRPYQPPPAPAKRPAPRTAPFVAEPSSLVQPSPERRMGARA